ncbi:hypothetical protein [Brumimicrobium glaciale]|jgi:hypothetical protein|uniref:hypothetical protein n=1 Tax=Brumimicrobium glaciale TaxID=200475 RepID=UPI001A922E0F|nr:hypothetical protein [Brumimicrobium glaciale]
MDYAIEIKFKEVLAELDKTFGGGLDVQSILFLIGVQELGKGHKNFSKREKTELMHVAVCTVLEPYGYYKTIGRDEDNWPHFEFLKELPPLDDRQQQHLMKEAIITYFQAENNESIDNIEVPEVLRYYEEKG